MLLNALVIFMTGYIVLRAIYVSFTHDEAFTFFNYISRPIDGTLEVTYTNNHLLNSLLARWSGALFGHSELALRLPNVLGGMAFFVFGARLLSRMVVNPWLVVAAFLALAFNTFTIDFFALCRGYGLSLGLLMASLYFQYRAFTDQRFLRYETMAIACTMAAVLSNYTLFNFFLLQLGFNGCRGVYRLIAARRDRKQLIRLSAGYFLQLAAIALFVFYFLGMMLNLNKLGNFNFGGTTGFWTDSVGSLAIFSCFPILGDRAWVASHYMPIMTAVILLVAAVFMLREVLRRNFSGENLFSLFLFLMIVGCGFAIYFQHMLLHIPFSQDRTVIYFIPLFSLLACSFLLREGRGRIWKWALLLLFFFPTIAAQAVNFNLEKVGLWPADMHMEEATLIVIDHAERSAGENRPVGVVVPYDILPSMNYYLYRNNCTSVQPVLFDWPNWWALADLSIDYKNDSRMFPDSPYRVIAEVADKDVKQRLTPVQNRHGRTLGFVDFENNEKENRQAAPGYQSKSADRISSSLAFSRTIRDTITDTLGGGNVYLLTCYLLPEETPVYAQAVYVQYRNGELIAWKSYDAVAFVRTQDQWQYATFRMYPDGPVLPGDALEFYMLNDHKEPVRVDDLRVQEFRAE
jgi:hypothetical protein